MGSSDFPGLIESDTESFLLGRGEGSEEPFANKVIFHAWSVIAYYNFYVLIGLDCLDLDAASSPHGFAGVDQQVLEDLSELYGIAAGSGIWERIDLDLYVREALLDAEYERFDELEQLDRLEGYLELFPGSGKPVDQRGKFLGGLPHGDGGGFGGGLTFASFQVLEE